MKKPDTTNPELLGFLIALKEKVWLWDEAKAQGPPTLLNKKDYTWLTSLSLSQGTNDNPSLYLKAFDSTNRISMQGALIQNYGGIKFMPKEAMRPG